MSAGVRPATVRERVEAEFMARFGASPDLLVRAPGRVNLIGEHTDYNDGFVLPVAIDRELWIALRPRADGRVSVHSLELGAAEFSTTDLCPDGKGWIEYVKGAAWALRETGHSLSGWDGVLGSDIPIGAGLSSSAALHMAVLRAFIALGDASWQAREAARIGQRVENDWIGVSSGIMDELVIAAGRRDHALLIDCRSLEVEPVPLFSAAAALVVLDTGTRRDLVKSAYNERRKQCEEAATWFDVPALRDVDRTRLDAAAGTLDRTIHRRARHVITENERTLEAARALRSGDLGGVGRLMDQSHVSLRDDFEVSTEMMNAVVDLARHQPGCLGARMTGAGFGGCVIAVVERDHEHTFGDSATTLCRALLGIDVHAYTCGGVDGVSTMQSMTLTAQQRNRHVSSVNSGLRPTSEGCQ